MKKLFHLLTALLLCALLCGCSAFSGDEAEETAERFLSLLNEGEYELAYDLLSANAQAEITREDFSQKYASIFSGLGVKSLIFGESSLSLTPIYATYQYSASYRTADYGDITKEKFYNSTMALTTGDDTKYAKNSKGKMVQVQEVGWSDANDTPTHIVLQFDSSHGGAYIGSVGNTLWVDNVRLAY